MPLIRDGVSEKVGLVFYAITLVISGFVIAFTTSWKISLVVLAATPVLIATVFFVSKTLSYYSDKGQRMYAEAGGIAQEVSFLPPTHLLSLSPLLHLSQSLSPHRVLKLSRL